MVSCDAYRLDFSRAGPIRRNREVELRAGVAGCRPLWISFRTLRHSFAAHLLEVGYNISTVRQLCSPIDARILPFNRRVSSAPAHLMPSANSSSATAEQLMILNQSLFSRLFNLNLQLAYIRFAPYFATGRAMLAKVRVGHTCGEIRLRNSQRVRQIDPRYTVSKRKRLRHHQYPPTERTITAGFAPTPCIHWNA